MIATVTNQGKTRWMVVDDNFNADKLIEFLGALIKEAEKKVFHPGQPARSPRQDRQALTAVKIWHHMLGENTNVG